MLKLCLTVILLGCVTQINCENLPVFIWGQKTPSFLPALNKLSSDEFVTLVKSQSDKESLVVVFVEKSLSVEDLSQCKLKTATCFENLKKIEQKTYLTAVEDPVEALEKSFDKQSQKTITVSNDGDFTDKLDGDVKILYIHLDEVNSNKDFAMHDELMSKLYNSIATKRENVIAIYTARHPSFVYSKPLIRKVREAHPEADAEADPKTDEKVEKPKEEAPKSEKQKAVEPRVESKQEGEAPVEVDQIVLVQDHFLFALNSLKIKDEVIAINTVRLTVNETANVPSEMTASLETGTHKVSFNLIMSGGTWYASTFSYNGARYYGNVPVSAYRGRSFGCGDLRLTDTKSYIIIGNVQMEPLFNPTNENPKLEQFTDRHNDCVGFFSPAIWGATFVVILLLSIMSWGLMMIMDIRTMDRFDDPKGKTITINAQE